MDRRLWVGLALCSALGTMAHQNSRSLPASAIDVEVVDGRAVVAASSVRTGTGQVTLVVAPGVVLHAMRHLRKPMDLPQWQGANRSNAPRHCEDLQRGHRVEGALSCFEISVAG